MDCLSGQRYLYKFKISLPEFIGVPVPLAEGSFPEFFPGKFSDSIH